jgi:hypothetical protein
VVVKVIPVEFTDTFVKISEWDTILNTGVVFISVQSEVDKPVSANGMRPVSPHGPTDSAAPTSK